MRLRCTSASDDAFSRIACEAPDYERGGPRRRGDRITRCRGGLSLSCRRDSRRTVMIGGSVMFRSIAACAFIVIALGFPSGRRLEPMKHPNRRAFEDVVHRERW